MDEQEQLRSRLEQDVDALNFGAVWDELVDTRYVSLVLSGQLDNDDLLVEARRLASFQRRSLVETGGYTDPRPGRSSGAYVQAELNENERAYAATYARYLQLRGEKWPPVIEFRERMLGGRLLSSDEARTLVWSQLAGFMPPEWFESEGVPIIGHNAQLLDSRIRRQGNQYHEYVVFRVDLPGRTVDVSKRGSGPSERRRNALQYRADEGHIEIMRVERSSVLYHLYEVSGMLAGNLFADEAGATRFVLTGEWPQAPPLEAEIGAGSITLTTSPWISEKTLRHFYLQLQRRLRGGDNRPIEEKARDGLLFVTEHTDAQGRKPTWEVLRKLWNERYPRRRFENRGDFYKAYQRAEKVLVPAPPDQF